MSARALQTQHCLHALAVVPLLTRGATLIVIWVLVLIEFLIIGLMVSKFLCVRFGRTCVEMYMLHVSLL